MTNSQTTEAELIRVHSNRTVDLKTASGKAVTLPFETFSAADVEYLERALAQPAQLHEVPWDAMNKLFGLPLWKDNNLWDDPCREVADRTGLRQESSTEFLENNRVYPLGESKLFGEPVYAVALYGTKEQTESLSLVFFNQGDVPAESDPKEIVQKIEDCGIRILEGDQADSRSAGARLGRAELGDRRLTARLMKMTGQFFEQPQANIPQSSGSTNAAKAAYRFLDNPEVNWEAILRSHYQATADRLHEHHTVLVATDTTTLNYTTHPDTEGLGYICENRSTRGIMVHDTMAFTPEGTPLGLMDVQCWTCETIGSKTDRHKKPIEQKESFKWIKSYRAVCEKQKQNKTAQLVMIADREGDIHELFCERTSHRNNAELLVRSEHSRNRKVTDEEGTYDYLWTLLASRPVLTIRKLLVPPAEDRPARQARLEVRSCPVTLKSPRRKNAYPDIELWAVYAIEIDAPSDLAPLEWMLLTTVPTQTASDALTRLEWYSKRWGIEVFHRILKSGCNIERRQLASLERLCNCLAIDMVVAWRIFFLTMQGREAPELDCTIYFTDDEWKALTTFTHKTKTPPPPASPPERSHTTARQTRRPFGESR